MGKPFFGVDHFDLIGPHRMKGDAVRYWIQRPTTSAPGSLEVPHLYLGAGTQRPPPPAAFRRESEIDDHGERYPPTWQGPDIYVVLNVPPGTYTLSLYFFNPNGHASGDRDRDYATSILLLPHYDAPEWHPTSGAMAEMDPAARSRVVNFTRGVWKRFLLRGPEKIAIRVARDYSLNAILQGAMLDTPTQLPAPYYRNSRAWQSHEQEQEARLVVSATSIAGNPHPGDGRSQVNAPVAEAARATRLMRSLEYRGPGAWARAGDLPYIMVARWCAAQRTPDLGTAASSPVARDCYYRLDRFQLWEEAERSHGIPTTRGIEQGLQWSWADSVQGTSEFNEVRRYVQRGGARKAPAIRHAN
jgi:hypothetical protein